jgi:hypothetical protein
MDLNRGWDPGDQEREGVLRQWQVQGLAGRGNPPLWALDWSRQALNTGLENARSIPMALIPRWRFMTDEAKALTRRTAVSALVVLVVLLVFRSLVPWVLVAVVAWWIWKAVSK